MLDVRLLEEMGRVRGRNIPRRVTVSSLGSATAKREALRHVREAQFGVSAPPAATSLESHAYDGHLELLEDRAGPGRLQQENCVRTVGVGLAFVHAEKTDAEWDASFVGVAEQAAAASGGRGSEGASGAGEDEKGQERKGWGSYSVIRDIKWVFFFFLFQHGDGYGTSRRVPIVTTGSSPRSDPSIREGVGVGVGVGDGCG